MLHQAAIPSVPRSVKDPVASHRANVDGTLNVLVAARDAGVKRLVFAGSSSAYGDTDELPKREELPPNPLSPYALDKLVGEQYLQSFTRLDQVETVTIRYFNVFRPAAGSKLHLFRRDLAVPSRAHGGRPAGHLPVTASRRVTSPTLATSSMPCCGRFDAPQASGEVINVATGTRISLNELLTSLQRPTGNSTAARYEPARAGDVRDSQAEIAKAERLLGYRPIVHLDEGLARTLSWFQSKVPADARTR